MEDGLRTYRTVARLHDGAQVILRPLQPTDGDRLASMFAKASEGDLDYFRSDVRNRDVLEEWVTHLDYDQVYPLVAVVNGDIVGDATMHFSTGPLRHIAEVRIFLIPDYRRRGLGTMMLETVVLLGKRMGLHQLEAEIPMEQTSVIKAFKGVGFAAKLLREDYFMTPDGLTHDVVVLSMRLLDRSGEF